jgi:tetraprenyl-beta-curcumene synthase
LPRDGFSTASEIVRRDVRTTVTTIFSRPSRLRRLIALGPPGWWRTARFLTRVIPQASRRLLAIRAEAERIPDPLLREQALSSIDQKAYHVQGGCILATFLPRESARTFIEIVTPLETIYDYLDNLCDRLGEVDPAAYPVLHEALLDAVDPNRACADYYRAGPFRDDGGYLRRLVERARSGIAALSRYDRVAPFVHESVRFYADLQAFKHLPSPRREQQCEAWFARQDARFAGLTWWEFAAAAGSSLPVFAMIDAALRPEMEAPEIAATYGAYFPSMSALHILLDYFIDQAEDREHAELNFIESYPSLESAVDGMRRLVRETIARLRPLRDGGRHAFVLQAMCTFYLTHRKVFDQRLDWESRAVLESLR